MKVGKKRSIRGNSQFKEREVQRKQNYNFIHFPPELFKVKNLVGQEIGRIDIIQVSFIRKGGS